VTDRTSTILVGVFGAPHGIRGEIRLKSYTAVPGAIGTYGRLRDASGTRSFRLEALRPIGKDMFVARVEGVADRNAAAGLKGTELFVPRDALPAPEDEEFYHADLIGLRVEDASGETLGRIVALHNFGAGDILEIAPPRGGVGKTTAMVAFSRGLVPVVEVASGRIVVALDPFAAEDKSD
jgi:16S rRNA processing protein RimM